MTAKTDRINARVTPAEHDILRAIIGTMDAPGREPATESEAIRMLLRQWAADNNYRPTEGEMKTVTLVNPWTKQPTTKVMTWSEIVAWATENVHKNDLDAWLKEAKAGYVANDGETLGAMIIGS